MNICIVSTAYPPEEGGVANYSYNLACALHELGHKVTVITKTVGRDQREVLGGVDVVRLRERYLPKIENWLPGLFMSYCIAREIDRLHEQEPIDVVEFPNWEGMGFWYARRKNRIPVATRLHTPYFETLSIDADKANISVGDKFICWLEKEACKKSDRLVSSTNNHKAFMVKEYALKDEKISIVPLGIQLCDVPKSYEAEKSDQLEILYVSRLESRKGTLTLIDAIPQISDVCPEVRFTFLGRDRAHAPGGIFFKDYFYSKYQHLADKVTFKGFVSEEELERHYAGCDIFVVPSLYESFGLIYVEAMMHGKPVIGCHAGGIPEVVADGDTGILVEPENVGQLATGIIRLARDRELRESMGGKARLHCEKKFGREIMGENMVDFYQNTIDECN